MSGLDPWEMTSGGGRMPREGLSRLVKIVREQLWLERANCGNRW